MSDLAFVLTSRPSPPTAQDVVAAGAALGLGLAADDGGAQDVVAFTTPDGTALNMAWMPFAHPDAATMPVGVLSPTPDVASACSAHLVLMGGLAGPDRDRDAVMFRFAAAVCQASAADAVMLGHAVNFQRADVFVELASQITDGASIPPLLAVTTTASAEDDNMMSLLTHGLARHAREELLIIAPIESTGAMGFVYDMAAWLMTEPHFSLPTGDTVGRTSDEKILVDRVPHPVEDDQQVIRLELA